MITAMVAAGEVAKATEATIAPTANAAAIGKPSIPGKPMKGTAPEINQKNAVTNTPMDTICAARMELIARNRTN
jgi:isocitrate/isopropylmalate dehydrogenase